VIRVEPQGAQALSESFGAQAFFRSALGFPLGPRGFLFSPGLGSFL
jgi:hypothetical protein